MQTPPLQAFGLFIVVFFPVLATITSCLRVYSKRRAGQFGLGELSSVTQSQVIVTDSSSDDVCIIIAMVRLKNI